MECPTEDQLIQFAISVSPEDETQGLSDHLACCDACARVYESACDTGQLLHQAHEYLDADHEAAKSQLLTALPGLVAQKSNRNSDLTRLSLFQWIGDKTMKHRIFTGGLLGTVLLVVVTIFLPMNSSDSKLLAMEKVVSRLQSIQTASWTMQTDIKGETPIKIQDTFNRFYWSKDKGSRMERYLIPLDEKKNRQLQEISVHPIGKRGVQIFHNNRRYIRPEMARSTNQPEFAFFLKLRKFRGQANRDLGFTKIDGKTARGFEVDMKKIDPDSFPGTMRLWADVETALPLRCEMTISNMVPGADLIQRLEKFEWDVPLDDSLFVVDIPENFKELKGPPKKSEAEQEQLIVKALQIYAKEMGGYPQVKKIYPDALLNQLHNKTGYYEKLARLSKEMQALQKKTANKSHPEKIVDHEIFKKYVALQNSTEEVGEGLRFLYQKQESQFFTQGSARGLQYYGLRVKPGEKDKLLLRWRLEDGRYRVLFGDLHFETIDQSQLEKLETL